VGAEEIEGRRGKNLAKQKQLGASGFFRAYQEPLTAQIPLSWALQAPPIIAGVSGGTLSFL